MLPGVSLVVVIIIASDAAVVTVMLDIFDIVAMDRAPQSIWKNLILCSYDEYGESKSVSRC